MLSFHAAARPRVVVSFLASMAVAPLLLWGSFSAGDEPEETVSEEPPLRLASTLPASNLPKYGSKATRLFHAQDYVRHHEAPDFWALMPYYVAQQNERSCSVASAVMMINAIRAGLDLTTDEELLTQSSLLEKVGQGKWKHSVGPQGGGVVLEDLDDYIRQTLKLYGPRNFEVQSARLNPERTDPYQQMRGVLVENERTADDFVLVVFWQAELTDDPEGNVGHIAPVGAFDEEHDRVLILDPDRQWYEPYWVPLKTLVDGMVKRTGERNWRPRGYLHVKLAP